MPVGRTSMIVFLMGTTYFGHDPLDVVLGDGEVVGRLGVEQAGIAQKASYWPSPGRALQFDCRPNKKTIRCGFAPWSSSASVGPSLVSASMMASSPFACRAMRAPSASFTWMANMSGPRWSSVQPDTSCARALSRTSF